MYKVNHPLFRKLGAFWITGNNNPFYSIQEAKKYQYNKGGDILGPKGFVIYPDPEPDCPTCPTCQTRMHKDSNSPDEEPVCPSCGKLEEPTVKTEDKPKPKAKSFWARFFKG